VKACRVRRRSSKSPGARPLIEIARAARLNLRNIPPEQRPEQEALEVDYDPWNGAADPRKISGESATS